MSFTTPKSRTLLVTIIISSVMVIDQVIKYLVKTGMSLGEKIEVTGWFQIFFTENRGMAFGMDFVGTMFLSLFRLVAIGFCIYLLARLIRRTDIKLGFIVCLAFIVAGAVGNIIDNFLYGLIFTESNLYAEPAVLTTFGEGYGQMLEGRVVDMFYFPLFRWPDWLPLIGGDTFFGAVFNFADAAISCGAIACLIFYRQYFNAEILFPKHPK